MAQIIGGGRVGPGMTANNAALSAAVKTNGGLLLDTIFSKAHERMMPLIPVYAMMGNGPLPPPAADAPPRLRRTRRAAHRG